MSEPSGPFRPGPVGLYIHVPYCASLCSYCDFYRCPSSAGVPDSFISHLLMEADAYRAEPPVEADTVYFGGGTPSLLTDPQLALCIGGLRERFDVAPHAEVTLEANPETVDERRAAAWLKAGVTRLSMGVQSFDAAEVAILERRCAPERARLAVGQAAGAGFANLTLDLMGGIPGQTPDSLARSLEMGLSLPVSHLSFYLLDLHRETRLFGRVLAGEVALPGEEALADLYERAHEILTGCGFEHYEISNFARPGFRCRHNLKYWRGGEYVGLGPSAHGRFRGWLTSNPRSIDAWAAALERGESAHVGAAKITERQRMEDEVIFGLRLAEGIPLETLESLTEGADLSARLGPLDSSGYILEEGGRLRLTPLGFLLSNEILGWLLPGLGESR